MVQVLGFGMGLCNPKGPLGFCRGFVRYSTRVLQGIHDCVTLTLFLPKPESPKHKPVALKYAQTTSWSKALRTVWYLGR